MNPAKRCTKYNSYGENNPNGTRKIIDLLTNRKAKEYVGRKTVSTNTETDKSQKMRGLLLDSYCKVRRNWSVKLPWINNGSFNGISTLVGLLNVKLIPVEWQ